LFMRKAIPSASRIIDLIIFIFTGVIFTLGYLLAVYYAKLFNADDADFLKNKIPFLHRMLRKVITLNG
jgi:hypothetical protein